MDSKEATINDLLDRVRNYDSVIQAVATTLGGVCCGGIDVDGPGSTKAVLVEAIEKLKSVKDQSWIAADQIRNTTRLMRRIARRLDGFARSIKESSTIDGKWPDDGRDDKREHDALERDANRLRLAAWMLEQPKAAEQKS